MLEKSSHILYHVLIVLFPILLYYFLAIRNHINSVHFQKIRLLGITLAILLLTMSFPVTYGNEFIFDFRIIPIFLSFIYIGLFHGILTILVMLLFLSLFGEFHVSLILNYSVITVIFYYLSKKYQKIKLKHKLFSISAVYVFLTITRAITLISNEHWEEIFIMVLFSSITLVTLTTAILLIENLREQILLQSELKRSEKLNLISQLAASVAHEVRNPMTTINGFLQLIKKDENLTTSQRYYIDISLGELARAQEIINDYLSLAKPDNNKCQVVNISEELSKTIELMTSYTNIQNIEISHSIESSLLIKGNADEMKQVFINIIKNGIEALNHNGHLEVLAFSEDEQVIIKIADNGEGMTKEQLSRIGTPFYSTKDKGTGIGLTLSFQIIKQNKGTIDIDSHRGVGTTFIITLPGYKPESIGESNIPG